MLTIEALGSLLSEKCPFSSVIVPLTNTESGVSKTTLAKITGELFSEKTPPVMVWAKMSALISVDEQYYLESVGIIENADAFKGLTKIYLSRGNLAKAKECYAKALRPDAYESNIDIMSVYAGYLERSGDLASASSVYRRVSVEKDSLYRVKEHNMLTQMDNLNRIFAEQKSDAELLKGDINRLIIWLIVKYRVAGSCLTLIMKLPSESEIVPLVVPFSATETKEIGFPSFPAITPEILAD